MTTAKDFLLALSKEQKDVFYKLLAFEDYLSLDWFAENSDIRLQLLSSVILSLDEKKWIDGNAEKPELYQWTENFPRADFLQAISPQTMQCCYQESVTLLQRNLPENEASTVLIARQCLLAGPEPSHIGIIYKAALIEAKHYRTSASIQLLYQLLFYIDSFLETAAAPTKGMLYIFLKALTRVVTYSTIFDPNQEKIRLWLFKGLAIADELQAKEHQAFLHLCMGIYFWMELEYKKSTEHFDQGWTMIKGIDDPGLFRRGLQLHGLALWIKGEMYESVRIYEESLGKTETFATDDLTAVTALHLAQSYAQIGMPQRGLGIAETILNQTQKQGHRPMASYALVTIGNILLGIMQLENSRTYFEKGLALSVEENLPMQEVIAVLGLAKIECLKGNYEAAADHFKIIAKISKSKWLHFFNLYPVFDTGYILYAQNAYPREIDHFFSHVDQIREEQVNPFLYSLIRLQHIQYLETNLSDREKIEQLCKVEIMLRRIGETLELAKLRIAIASLSLQLEDRKTAESYAQAAWKFLKPISQDVFPANLQHLISDEGNTGENKLSDLIVEIGEALSNQENIEQLLTGIITSISRMMGAERTALFIKDKHSGQLQVTASRNFIPEHIRESGFRAILQEVQSAAAGNNGQVIERKIPDPDSADIRHIVITPLVLNQKITGILYLDSRFFTFDDITNRHKLLSALGTQIAVSIDRAQAYDKIIQLNNSLIRENQYYRDEQMEFRPFGEIIGTSGVILQVQELIHKVAATPSTVLIHGETGVGKELIARAIHNTSPRKDKPFIRVNCAALPDTLIDSELFGHEKGAFTGAIKTKAGRFELAHQGTIFLDEISELPLPTQSRLLRILQEKEFQRVGGTRTFYSDFRLIAATNKNLEREVEKGRFRADLFYRLNIFPIFVPSLRERKEDIPSLAAHFLKLHCSQSNKPYRGISPLEMEKLMSYNWPGNIRELSNIIERSVILDKPGFKFDQPVSKKDSLRVGQEFVNMKELEKAQIVKALRQTNGQIGGLKGAAALLGVNRTTLMSRIKKHNIAVKKTIA